MASIIQGEEGYYFRDDDDFAFPLNEDNTLGYLHRSSPFMDRLSIQDPRDEQWWTWFRSDVEPEMFEHIEKAVRAVGCLMLRNTPLPEIDSLFTARHELSEADMLGIAELLDNETPM